MSEKSEIPTTPDEITPAWLTMALRSKGMEATVNSLTIEPLSGGYLGQIVRLRPEYDPPEKNLPKTIVAKFPLPDPDMRANFFWTCLREDFFYRELAAQVSLYTPRCYFSDINEETFKSIFLFEDLAHLRKISPTQGCTLAEAHTVVTQLAQHHARWWQDPRLPAWEAYVKPINQRWDGQEAHWHRIWDNFEAKVTTLLPNTYLPAPFLTMGRRANSQILYPYDQLATRPFTLLHYDTHTDNFLFANSDNDPAHTVLDWQGLHYGPGVVDVSYFFILSLPVSLRRQAERDLLQSYHATLVAHDVTDYTFEQCWQDYRLSFFRAFETVVNFAASLDLTDSAGLDFMHACLPRVFSFVEDHRVDEFLRQDIFIGKNTRLSI